MLDFRSMLRGIACGGAVAICVLALAAQREQPFRATTRMVELNVVASDREGRPVENLAQEDFTILDGGREERIAVFRFEKAAVRAPKPLPAGVYSNRIDELGSAPSAATVILFDGLNTPFADQAYARDQILKFAGQLRPGDRVALYVMGRGPRVLQDFTDDPLRLAKALANFKGELAPSLEAPLYDPDVTAAGHFGSWLGELSYNLYDHFAADRAYRTLRALIAIANHLERLPGRKNLIWVSGTFPLTLAQDSLAAPRKRPGSEKIPETERAVRALSRADLAVYTVDARGLVATQEYVGDLRNPRLKNPDTSGQVVMRLLADRTGGRAFYNNNDLAAALRRAADDARASYVLGYYPSHQSWNGRFRPVEVKVRRPEAVLQYRHGYYAQPGEPSEPWYRENVLDAAIWSPLDASGLGLTVRMTPASGGAIRLGIQVDARNLTFYENRGKHECALDTWVVQIDREEHEVKRAAKANNLSLDAETYRRVTEAGGLMLVEQVSPEPGTMVLRVLARDVASGVLGSVTIPWKGSAN